LRTLRAPGDVLPSEDAAWLRETLLAGTIGVFPTDTLYAVGGLALLAEASRRVRAAKGRDAAKPLPLVAADLAQVEALGVLTAEARALAHAFWPGPLTLVLAAAPTLPPELTSGQPTLAVRIPGRALTRALCGLAGPLISTSANASGEAPATTCAAAAAALGPAVSWAIDGGAGGTTPSTIVDASGAAPRLLRAGAVPWAEIETVWRRRV
jgi:L-threonylcarbamoyladenylate synthase